MKTKRIDFNIDLAKKIQAGEVPGRIVTRNGQPARIICSDRKDEIYPIVALVGKYENPRTLSTNGEHCLDYETSSDLFIEVPAPQFSPFDRVLVWDDGGWRCTFYSHLDTESGLHVCADGFVFNRCIPYEGNEHLVGTTDEPKEDEE